MTIVTEQSPDETGNVQLTAEVRANADGWRRARAEYPEAVERIVALYPGAQEIIDGTEFASGRFVATVVLQIPMTMSELFVIEDTTTETAEQNARFEDVRRKVLVECDEPRCASFGTGHWELAIDEDEQWFIHELLPLEGDGYSITVQRPISDSDWSADVVVDRNDPSFTPAQARAFAAALLVAADQCEAFNK